MLVNAHQVLTKNLFLISTENVQSYLIQHTKSCISPVGLRSEKSAVRTLCERWVEHSLSRGDAGRLLEPLLLSLLGKKKFGKKRKKIYINLK